ncbi:TPA: 50S ribosomal protein L10 [Candidatus Saccharibacteria bacterium]|nr:50S ribosomal protein L10 [Candidatus Saccharibacteria bacterium]HIO87349.1 50S ribosomal protein L10 [Candidatus Saccharibacteria bacterium]
MAISRIKKEEIVAEISDLLAQSKMTVLVDYSGLGVKQFQELRRRAKAEGVTITVAKNRLVKLALSKNDTLKDVDDSMLTGQLAIAFGVEDEVAPAQILAQFAKEFNALEFVGGFNADGEVFDASQITALSKLPSKDILRGQVVGTIAAPLTGFVGVLSGNIRSLGYVLNARKQQLEG